MRRKHPQFRWFNARHGSKRRARRASEPYAPRQLDFFFFLSLLAPFEPLFLLYQRVRGSHEKRARQAANGTPPAHCGAARTQIGPPQAMAVAGRSLTDILLPPTLKCAGCAARYTSFAYNCPMWHLPPVRHLKAHDDKVAALTLSCFSPPKFLRSRFDRFTRPSGTACRGMEAAHSSKPYNNTPLDPMHLKRFSGGKDRAGTRLAEPA
ncbi:hypothetical protein MTO96_006689 [Rhipicephalus appendiculatus]